MSKGLEAAKWKLQLENAAKWGVIGTQDSWSECGGKIMLIRQDWIKICQGFGRLRFCSVFRLLISLRWRMRPLEILTAQGTGHLGQVTGGKLSQFPLQGFLLQTYLKLVSCLTLSLGICSLAFFFFKSKLKITQGQSGRKVLMLDKIWQYFSFFFFAGFLL